MKAFKLYFVLILGIFFISPFYYMLLGQNLESNDVVISGYDANLNTFKFITLVEIPANTRILFTDDGSIFNPIFNLNYELDNYELKKLEGVIVFQPEEDVPFGTEILWNGDVSNKNFKSFGSFYLSIVKDEIIIFQNNADLNIISSVSYGQTNPSFNINNILKFKNGLGSYFLKTQNFITKNDLLEIYFNESNWGEIKGDTTSQNLKQENNIQVLEKLNSTDEFKIMPLGDSVTRGKNKLTNPDFVGYRRPLYNKLDSAGYNVLAECFLGSITSDTILTDFDTDHEGHGGYQAYTTYSNGVNWKDLYHNLDGTKGGENWLLSNTPDYILLHIGTNDIGQGELPQSVANQVSDVLDLILDFDDNIEVILAKIINVDSTISSKYSETAIYNSLLENIVQSHPKANRIKLIDMEPVLDYPTDLIDDVHPNNSGYEKMANAWFNSIQNYFEPTLVLPVDSSIENPNTILFSWKSKGSALKSYQLQISEDESFAILARNIIDIADTQYTVNGLFSDTKYYWRMRAKNYGGYSNWSQIDSFSTLPIWLDLKVYVEGAYLSTGLQSTKLSEHNLLPISQPFNNSPWNYFGDEENTSNSQNIVDWALISLSESSNSTNIIKKMAVLLEKTGKLVNFDGIYPLKISGVVPGFYYIFVEHRNHLKILSNNPINLH